MTNHLTTEQYLELADKVLKAGMDPQEDRLVMDTLFKGIFALDKWSFAVKPDNPTEPLVVEWKHKFWLMMFTDVDLLKKVVKKEGYNRGEDILFLSMDPLAAADWAYQMRNAKVYGVHFNFSCPGWYIPVVNFPSIIKHLKLR